MLRIFLAALVGLAAALPAFAQGVGAPAVKSGDRWVYNSPAGRRVVTVNSVGSNGSIDVSIDTPDLGGLEATFTKDWDPTMAPDTTFGTVKFRRYDPPLCQMPAPPWSVGQTWSCNSGWSDGTYSGNLPIKGKIEAAEKVTVPAGTFDTLRVVTKSGETVTTCWYAAKVEQFVRCKSGVKNLNFDLTSYSLH
jgi:hypothetical protein